MREGMVRDLAKWDQWWDDYTNYIVHYAKIAEEKQVPVLCLGCEMNSTEEFEDKWRNLIAKVRDVYNGLDHLRRQSRQRRESEVVRRGGLHQHERLPPDPVRRRPAARDADRHARRRSRKSWPAMKPIREHLAAVSAKWNKPILFIESGVTPVRGCAHTPWAHVDERDDRPTDEQEQANYYQAMFETYWDEPWFMGWCWWDWPARLYDKSDAGDQPQLLRLRQAGRGRAARVVRQGAERGKSPVVGVRDR